MSAMEKNALYYIWLQHVLGFGSAKIRTVLRFYKTPEEFYRASIAEKRMLGCFTKSELNAFEKFSLENCRSVIDRCERLHYNIITLADPQYPQRLKEIYNPPCVLYCQGELPDIDKSLCIAVVGTRMATQEGVRTAFSFAAGLTQAGAVVVSGGARGIDSASHRGALQAGGTTLCVLGCGINYRYLPENAPMRSLITKQGALVSEYPPDTPPLARNFPMRNRIISGLCSGVVIIEAGEKSGSLITADLALEQGRDVFAVPGSITSAVTGGSNSLIKQGAKPVTCCKDILEEYMDTDTLPPADFLKEVQTPAYKQADIVKDTARRDNRHKALPVDLPEDISDDAKTLFAALSEIPVHTDTLIQKTGLPAGRVLPALTQLELLGLVKPCSGRRYSK